MAENTLYNLQSFKKTIIEEKCEIFLKKKKLIRDLESILNIRVVLAISKLKYGFECKFNIRF
jgi:hypothetical protein